jgi:hypothetical protein
MENNRLNWIVYGTRDGLADFSIFQKRWLLAYLQLILE